jgi:hypothetical protein
MAGDDKLRVEVTADSSGLKDGLSQAKSAVADAAAGWESTFKDAESAMSGSAANMVSSIMAIGPAVAAAAAAFAAFEGAKAAVEGFATYAGNIERMSEVLGISAESASGLNASLKVLGVSSDEYIGAMMRMERQVKKNEEVFTAQGVAVRDASGAFLPQTQIFDNVIAKMQEYKAGADQMQFAMDMLGARGADLAFRFIHLKEATEIATPIMKQLGLEMGQNAVESARKLEMQSRALGLVWDGIKVKIGEVLVPVIKALIQAFDWLKIAAEAAGNSFKAIFTAIYDQLSGVGKAVALAIKGHFQDALAAIKEGNKAAEDEMRAMMERNTALWDEYARRAAAPDKSPAKTSGSKSYTPPETGGTQKSRLPQWEEELRAREVAEERFFGLSISEEKAFWESKLAISKAGSEEYTAVKNKLDQALIKSGRDSFEQDQKNAKESAAMQASLAADSQKRLETEIKVSDSAAKAREKEIETKYKLGQTSVAQEIAQLRQVEDQRYNMEHAALLQEIAQYDENDNQFTALQNKMLEAKQKNLAAMKALDDKYATETMQTWQKVTSPIKSAFDGMFQGIMQGTQTLSQVMMRFLENIATAFLKMGSDIAMKWIENQAMAALGVMAAKKTEAAAVIPANAAEAGSGAVAATAAIPVVGPGLAPEAGAAAFAEALSFEGMALAAAGYDIPAGINPLVQAHAEEMVLPAHLAEGIRGLIGANGRPAGGGNNYGHTFNISSIGPKETAAALKRALRMGYR